MKDVWILWDNTRMVVFTAICAALYAAILIPFKVFPIIPGITELRPANAVPVICSFLFGPAAAWGAAIGNVIGDFFGGIGPGDFFGFFGNFLYGMVPYKVWDTISPHDPIPKTAGLWLRFVFTLFVASAACALVVGWGLNLLGFVPFSVLGNIVLFNNFVSSLLFAPLLLAVIYPRVARGRLLYVHLLERPQSKPRLVRLLGLGLLTAASVGGLVIGNLLSAGRWTPALFVELGLTTQTRAAEVGVGLLPLVVLACVGLMLL
ncbi:MAG: QueT transporter family protein [Thermodesulfobacteriota bacterium]|jgi:energy-coupling factor transport system substrate-specific component